MTVWYHQSTILKCKSALRMAGLIAVCVAFITTLFLNSATYAAPGINQTLSFQGRLLTSAGGVVPDGYYNMQFKIYEGGTASGGGTEKWSEAYTNNNANAGVNVKNGYFSVNLGSKTAFASLVNWNDDTLYLSMNIAGNSPSCTTFASCSPDGEMTPMKRITSVPFALNSAQLGGRTADGFIQNGTSPQTADFNIVGTGTATSLQAGNLDTASAGTLTLGGTNATSITMADDVTVAAGKSLTLAGGNTASRPASPSEGTLYFDTDTKQILVYSNGKWQTSKDANVKVVAASNSLQIIKDNADYVADGTGDQVEINAALVAAEGNKVYLAAGTYTINASIAVPNHTVLSGAGNSTNITIPNGHNTNINAITNLTGGGSGTGITVQDMRIEGNENNQSSGTMNGIYFSGVNLSTTVRNVAINSWRSNGIYLNDSYNVTLTDNTVSFAAASGIYLYESYGNKLINNRVMSSGGNAHNNAIYLASSGNNLLLNNHTTDNSSTTTNNAITFSNAASNSNTLTGNNLGGGQISDSSTGNIYSNQLDSNGKLVNKSTGGSTVQTLTNNATAFQVQNAAGVSALTVNTSNNAVLVAGTLDTTTATTLTIGATTATAINMGTTSGNILTTMNGRALVKSTSGNNSTTAFQVQNASSTALLTADTTNMQVVIGNGGNTITLSSNGITLAGTTRGAKQIRLAAEYANTVLDNGMTGNNAGTMLSSADVGSRINFYRWIAASGSAQSYDIVTQVPIPQDFSAWAPSNPLSITSRTSSVANGTITLELRDSTGSIRCNFTPLTMGSTNTWITNTPNCLTGTYTAGDYITLRIRMSSASSANTDVGNIVLNYLSNK